MIITKAQALKASKRKFENVPIPELEGELRMGTLMAGPSLAAAKLHARLEKGEDVLREIALLILESSVVDEAGNPFFGHAEAVHFLDNVASAETVMLIVKSVPGAGKKPESLEALAGNSGASTTGA